MEKNWIIRTRLLQILGPVSKKKIIVSMRIDVKKANRIADGAKGFESKISLQKELMKANAKSIMGVIMLVADEGDEL